MAVAWMGSDKLGPLLDGGTSILVSNDAEPETMVSIVGFACALHGDQPYEVRRSTEVELGPGDSLALVEERLAPVQPVAVETVLRILSPRSQDIVEVYIHSDDTRTSPIERVEVGVVATERAPQAAVPVPEIAGLSAYVTLEP